MLSKKRIMMHIKDISPYLDFANHKANSTHSDIEQLCKATIEYNFNSSFVNPLYVSYAKNSMNGKSKVGTVISFPLGQELISIKTSALKQALNDGADELDISLNVGLIKEHNWDQLVADMETMVKIVKSFDSKKIIKFIPENGYLTDYEIKKVAELLVQAGADFYKTCSGYGPRGATLDDVRLVREAIGNAIKIKVAGGISTYDQAISFINAGANRIGTSAALEIIKQQNAHSDPR